MINRNLILMIVIALIALTRFLPHPPNMTPIIAISMLSVAFFKSRHLQFGIPLLLMVLTDAIIGFHSLVPVVYLAILLAGCSGYLLRRQFSFVNILGSGLLGSIVFFVITNVGVWVMSDMYAYTLAGFIQCFVMAIPFFHNTLIATLGVLLGIYGMNYCWSFCDRKCTVK